MEELLSRDYGKTGTYLGELARESRG
jgi:hypothetical protein